MRKVYFILFLLVAQHAVAQWQYAGSKIYYNGGNVGIGHEDPIAKLHVHGTSFIFGDIRLGQQKEDLGQGSHLVFNDHGNTDPIWMARYNVASNVSELRINIGDDGDDNDKIVMGYSLGSWFPKFSFSSNGKLNVSSTTRSGATNEVSFATQSDLGVSIQQANINGDFVNSNNYLSIYAHNMHHTGTGWVRRNQYSSGWATVLNNGYYDVVFAPDNQSGSANQSVTPTSYLRIGANGNVGIGTSDPGNYKLAVEGKVGAREVKVTVASWADYVFNKDYKLMSLANLEDFIKKNKHLPNIPSAQQVEEDGGIELGDMNRKLLEKIEELTLYVIELKKENEAIKEEVKKLAARQQAGAQK